MFYSCATTPSFSLYTGMVVQTLSVSFPSINPQFQTAFLAMYNDSDFTVPQPSLWSYYTSLPDRPDGMPQGSVTVLTWVEAYLAPASGSYNPRTAPHWPSFPPPPLPLHGPLPGRPFTYNASYLPTQAPGIKLGDQVREAAADSRPSPSSC